MERLERELQSRGATTPASRQGPFRLRPGVALARTANGSLHEGRVFGRLAYPPRGDKGHGYDPMFVADGYDLPSARWTRPNKNRISHRARAFETFCQGLPWLRQRTRAARTRSPRRCRQPPDGGFGVYVHWPFCAAKCPYCDFNSHVRHGGIDEHRFLAAYLRELETLVARTDRATVDSIFFGGGTPSLMAPSTVAAIIDRISSLLPLSSDIEISLEANPGSVEAERFRGYRTAGVNRVSLGLQALNDRDLKFLGRIHSVAEARLGAGNRNRHLRSRVVRPHLCPATPAAGGMAGRTRRSARTRPLASVALPADHRRRDTVPPAQPARQADAAAGGCSERAL